MDAMTAFLNDQPAWHWWALGAVLLAIEIASTTQYLMWPGIAAVLVGVLKFLDSSLDGRLSVFLFAVLSVAATIAWKRSPWGRKDHSIGSTLNQRNAQYVGRTVKAAIDFVGGRGAVLVDDTRWNAISVDGSAPVMGDMLEVADTDGTVLKVRQANAGKTTEAQA